VDTLVKCIFSAQRTWKSFVSTVSRKYSNLAIDCFDFRGQQPCKYTGTRDYNLDHSFLIGTRDLALEEFNSHGIGLEHQHGRRFISWGTFLYDCGEVIWKHFIWHIKQPDSLTFNRENHILIMTSYHTYLTSHHKTACLFGSQISNTFWHYLKS